MTLPPNDLPPIAVSTFGELSDEQQVAFVSRYNAAKRSMALMVALSILFPIQLLLLGKVLLGLLFLITGGGFGVWYVIEWFLTPGRVRDYNTKVAGDILAGMAAGPGQQPSPVDEEE
jgi:hypothetical protein